MQKTILFLALLFMVLGFRNPAPEKIIIGTVVDAVSGQNLPGVSVSVKGTTTGTTTDSAGKYSITLPPDRNILVFSFIGYTTQEITVRDQTSINVKLQPNSKTLSEVVVIGYGSQKKQTVTGSVAGVNVQTAAPAQSDSFYANPTFNTEDYNSIQENIFLEARKNPLSTFSIDVDAASYSNVRRFLRNGQSPPKDAVRIEEMINYFKYDYPQPTGSDPVSITSEMAPCPWNSAHQLLHIGLQGKTVPTNNLPPSNLVFLIDVSGSMMGPDRLDLIKAGFKLLVEQLRPQDKVAIVVYAGAAGIVLPATPGSQKDRIIRALEGLQAGGSTAGGAGIKLAYNIAKENFKPAGNNRVILATDGDFNVGVSSNAELERLIEEKRETGIFLTVLGFGMGNLKDSRMEQLADKGNGNYAYVDTILEAKKVFVNEFGGTLFTIAKDVKLQLEFNPAQVKAYRLVGYENRALKNEDFNNDKKDAGDLGSGHTVTALYEIIPASAKSGQPLATVDELKYQKSELNSTAANTNEVVTLKLRYKEPTGNQSKLLQKIITAKQSNPTKTSDNFRFSVAVAQFGMLLRDSEFKAQASYASVLELAQNARGKDEEGYRIEFINLVKSAQLLNTSTSRKGDK